MPTPTFFEKQGKRTIIARKIWFLKGYCIWKQKQYYKQVVVIILLPITDLSISEMMWNTKKTGKMFTFIALPLHNGFVLGHG